MTCCKRIGNGARCCTHSRDCEIDIALRNEEIAMLNLLCWMYVHAGYIRSYVFTGIGRAWTVRIRKGRFNKPPTWCKGNTYNYGIGEPNYPVPAIRQWYAFELEQGAYRVGTDLFDMNVALAHYVQD